MHLKEEMKLVLLRWWSLLERQGKSVSRRRRKRGSLYRLTLLVRGFSRLSANWRPSSSSLIWMLTWCVTGRLGWIRWQISWRSRGWQSSSKSPLCPFSTVIDREGWRECWQGFACYILYIHSVHMYTCFGLRLVYMLKWWGDIQSEVHTYMHT